MKALSVRPPWAYYIIYGIPYGIPVDNGDGSTSVKMSDKVIIKDVENRTWKLPKSFELPQRIYIHVGKRDDNILAVLDICCRKLGLPGF